MEVPQASSHPFHRTIEVTALLTAVISTLGLSASLLKAWSWSAFGSNYVPMAPFTGIWMLALSLVVVARNRRPSHLRIRRMVTWTAALAAGFCLMVLVQSILYSSAPLEEWLIPSQDQVQGIPIGRMSPLTAATFICICLALGIQQWRVHSYVKGRHAAAALAMIPLCISALIILSYGADVPLLYGTSVIPMALTTAMAFQFLSLAVLFSAGPNAWPLCMFIPSEEHLPSGSRWLASRFLLLFVSLVFGIGLGGSLLLKSQLQSTLRKEEQELLAVADLKISQITTWRHERWADADQIYRTRMLQKPLMDFLYASQGTSYRQELSEWMEILRSAGNLRCVALFDERGTERLCVPAGVDRDQSLPQEVRLHLKRSGISITDLHQSIPNNETHLNIWIPLGTQEVKTREPRGLLMFELEARSFLFPLLQSWPTISSTAETLLVRKEGDDVVYLNELRHRSRTALTLRHSIHTNSSLPEVKAIQGYEGLVHERDYRDERVLAALRKVPDSPWCLVAKMDESEILGPVRQRMWIIECALIAVILLAALAVNLMVKRHDVLNIHHAKEELELRVAERTQQLENLLREMESFNYSVSHDLRSPLRGIAGYSHVLLQEHAQQLDQEGKRYLERIQAGTIRMGQIIDDLLRLSQVNQGTLSMEFVDLSIQATQIIEELKRRDPKRDICVTIKPGLNAIGDRALLMVLLENLLGNAWKFTSKKDCAHIQFGRMTMTNGAPTFFVQDDGVGFDMAYTKKLFNPFQRLHGVDEFDGTGVGLSIAQRIVKRHGGAIWFEAQANQGACFFFTLPH